MSDNEYVVTQKEAADFLNVSTKSISRYRKRGLPYKLILNPGTGKQEVRFCYVDLERWDEGRQLLATYARDGGEPTEPLSPPTSVRAAQPAENSGRYLEDLLTAYQNQIELLKEQLEDMRGQLARRDRQIDDLMRLMVGLQLEYKPVPPEIATVSEPLRPQDSGGMGQVGIRTDGLYQAMDLVRTEEPAIPVDLDAELDSPPSLELGHKVFSRDELARSVRRLRAKGKSYEEIARGLNQIKVATLSGLPKWTMREVQNLLPALVATPVAEVLGEQEID
ncbi:hypothetical protein [Desulfobulbus propionicus]|jgi:DNA-binding transcriptional MerR regulator